MYVYEFMNAVIANNLNTIDKDLKTFGDVQGLEFTYCRPDAV